MVKNKKRTCNGHRICVGFGRDLINDGWALVTPPSKVRPALLPYDSYSVLISKVGVPTNLLSALPHEPSPLKVSSALGHKQWFCLGTGSGTNVHMSTTKECVEKRPGFSYASQGQSLPKKGRH